MRILLAQNMTYLPTHGGANKGNKLLLEALAEKGHTCRMVALSTSVQGYRTRREFLVQLALRGIPVTASDAHVDHFTCNGVAVDAVVDTRSLCLELAAQIRQWEPTWVLVSSEDTGQVVLATALAEAGGHVVYLARTTSFLPFGPGACLEHREGSAFLRRTAAVVTVSRYLQQYVRRWGGMPATYLPILPMTLGRGPFPCLASFENDYVTMVNPCAIKGIFIFLGLAERLPQTRFAAVPTWGTTSEEIDLLKRRTNITLIEPADDIEQVLVRTRALLMPSLWDEAFGRTAAEAMLRGIPVLASDVGGLPEAKLGVDYILPVRPIMHYDSARDDKMKPIPVVPEQDLEPWCQALHHLLSDRDHYQRLSQASREAAHRAYASSADPLRPFEQFLESLAPVQPRLGSANGGRAPSFGAEASARPVRAATLTGPRRALLALRVARERKAGAPAAPIPRVARDRPLPLSFAQERLWFLHQLDGSGSAYNLPLVLRLCGRLHADALEQSLNEIIDRHEVLRTTFEALDGTPVQVIAPRGRIPLEAIHLETPGPGSQPEDVLSRVGREVRRPFDLARGPLMRAALLRVSDQEHILMVIMHHAISDGWSLRLLGRELQQLYRSHVSHESAALPDLPIQYADYACWERRSMLAAFPHHLDYWNRRLQGVSDLDLPTDYARPHFLSHRGANIHATMNTAVTGALQKLSQESRGTLFMTLFAAFSLLLHRLAGQDDVCVGIPIVNRSRPELEDLIGFFVNTLALRTDFSGNLPFGELLDKVRTLALEAYAHQELPLERLVQELPPERHANRNPFFQTFFNMHGSQEEPFSLHDLEVSTMPVQEVGAKFDLTLHAQECDGQLNLDLVYSLDLFTSARATALLDQFTYLLTQIAENPRRHVEEFTLVTPATGRVLPHPTEPLPPGGAAPAIHAPFVAQAEAVPQRAALVEGDSVWTYADLQAASDRVAATLCDRGLETGGVVALYGGRSASLVCALLGTLKAGGAFLILDPSYPEYRLVEYIRAARPGIWLEHGAVGELPPLLQAEVQAIGTSVRWSGDAHDRWPQAPTDRNPTFSVTAEQTAYVVFTSGTTHDQPKGVRGTHRPVSHFLEWHCRTFGLNRRDRFALLSGLSHDPLLRDVFTPLWLGATLYIPRAQDREAPWRLWDWVNEKGITVLHITPRWAEVLERAAGASGRFPESASLRWIFFGGDVLTRQCVRRARRFAPHATCVNFYGATETPQAIAYHVIGAGAETDMEAAQDAGRSLPLGAGIEGVQLLVVNRAGHPAGVGEEGEICVRSRYLSEGYVNDAGATAERFIPHPGTGRPEDRVYKTGDRGRYLPDGNVEFCGRGDRQVKVRGFRIEPAEIESALLSHPAVQQAAVIVADDPGAGPTLVAFLTCRNNLSTLVLRRYLHGLLPDYMIPGRFVVLDSLPLTANGKVDTARLRSSVPDRREVEGYVAPRTAMESAVAAIWGEVIGMSPIGIHDNFFDLGGHSLLVVKAVFLIERRLGIVVPFRDFFQQTLAQFAAACEQKVSAHNGPVPAEIPGYPEQSSAALRHHGGEQP